jgi:hypothetical protein
VSSTYANILKYHIQGMPTNIILQVFLYNNTVVTTAMPPTRLKETLYPIRENTIQNWSLDTRNTNFLHRLVNMDLEH